MDIIRFLYGLFRAAPRKGQLLRALVLGGKGGDRSVISDDGTRLSARASGSGPPVILVHGTLDGIGALTMLEVPLTESYEVWVYDRRGRGGSGDTTPYSLAREVDDLRAVMAAAGGTPHVVGHSFGAVVALQARLAGASMRSLVLYEPPINSDAIPHETIETMDRAIDAGDLDRAISELAGLAGLREDEVSIAMSVPPVRQRLRAGAPQAPRELRTLHSCEWTGLPVTDVPVLIVRGSRDSSAAYPTSEQIGGLAVDVETVVLPGQGHLGHIFTPTTLTDAITGFLDRH